MQPKKAVSCGTAGFHRGDWRLSWRTLTTRRRSIASAASCPVQRHKADPWSSASVTVLPPAGADRADLELLVCAPGLLDAQRAVRGGPGGDARVTPSGRGSPGPGPSTCVGAGTRT